MTAPAVQPPPQTSLTTRCSRPPTTAAKHLRIHVFPSVCASSSNSDKTNWTLNVGLFLLNHVGQRFSPPLSSPGLTTFMPPPVPVWLRLLTCLSSHSQRSLLFLVLVLGARLCLVPVVYFSWEEVNTNLWRLNLNHSMSVAHIYN